MELNELNKELDAVSVFKLAKKILNDSQCYLVIGTTNVDDNRVKHDLSVDGGRYGDLNILYKYRRVIDEFIREFENE